MTGSPLYRTFFILIIACIIAFGLNHFCYRKAAQSAPAVVSLKTTSNPAVSQTISAFYQITPSHELEEFTLTGADQNHSKQDLIGEITLDETNPRLRLKAKWPAASPSAYFIKIEVMLPNQATWEATFDATQVLDQMIEIEPTKPKKK